MRKFLFFLHLTVVLLSLISVCGCFGGYLSDGLTTDPIDQAQISVKNCPDCEPLETRTAPNGGWYFDGCNDPQNRVLPAGVQAVEIHVDKQGYTPATVYHQVSYVEPYGNDCYKDQRDIQIFPIQYRQCVPYSTWYSTDCDFDGLPNLQEDQIGTSYLSADTDCDGAQDSWEVNGHDFVDFSAYGMSPTSKDCVFDWQSDQPPSSFTYTGNYPNKCDRNKFDSMQGITHDNNYWYISQKTQDHFLSTCKHAAKLHKFRVGDNLSSASPVLSMNVEKHGNHPGDITYYKYAGNDYLFVPVYDKGKQETTSRILVFRTSNLELVVASDYADTIKGPSWVALDPAGNLYHNNGPILPVDGKRIQKYSVDWNKIATGDSSFLTHLDEYRLYRENGTEFATYDGSSNYEKQLAYQQGAVFSTDGKLFFISHGGSKVPASLSGIKVFDSSTGRILDRSNTSSLPFKFQFDPTFPKYEEPEGMTVWDLDDLNAPHAPNMSGQLHVLMIRNESDCDDIYLKHYRVPCGERCRI